MALKLYHHPLSSYCQKALIAFYEAAVAFEPVLVQSPDDWATLRKLAPLGKFPLLRDEGKGALVAESSIIIEYLVLHYARQGSLIPENPALALETRRLDRFFDLYVNAPMQAIVKNRLRPAEEVDRSGVADAQKSIRNSYAIIETELAGRDWANGDAFSMADCAAAPALYYTNLVAPFAPKDAVAAAYLARLSQRPSVARAFREAEPYRSSFPAKPSAAEFASGAST